ncbi:TRAP-type mannitol/chloroaromatic compound transport system, substrate-binding protein [Tistlia consotensis]|uniref:TRAP-type mannitol/chloroaromatic compound transport system, substrate-binding protein n=1 Tax=Tistlia consotensis USBA 355 TaxID=560819 RepID=A0A1Y6C788_9PROT|nr:TRAP transporter substrate-binding protein [Tistlia consotensis]SMF47668.1 TRAP-type mannitol/chloroaromatic compound transport system, substrate-binding protein [Tistlia consotensis USBA 355]SNR82206.1 TRAP-type mannitol/chloroaromatic compound transport system, substrate-binding protein [Tistlia consotensis]
MRKLLLAAALLSLTAGGASAGTYSLQSAFGKNLPILGPAADRFAAEVDTLTGGKIAFKHYGAGELSPPFEILDNVGAGAIDAGWSYAGYAAGKAPAAALFGSIPFGPDAIKYVSWVLHGGGLQLWREIYAPFNVVPMPCGVIISEAGGWYTKEIKSPEDLKGLKIRIGGLGGKVLSKLGANPMSLPAGEISTSLETGRLDATELSFPMIDRLLGLDKVAKHYYFPGWHQPSGFIELYVNKDKWNGWSDAERTAVETVCSDIDLWTIGTAVAGQQEALDAFRADGVTVERFPDSVIEALRKATAEVYAENEAADPMFRKVLESYRAFSKAYDQYQALNRL